MTRSMVQAVTLRLVMVPCHIAIADRFTSAAPTSSERELHQPVDSFHQPLYLTRQQRLIVEALPVQH